MGQPKTKAGSFWFAAALLLALAAPMFWFVGAEHQARVDALRRDGLVTIATIESKERVEDYYTDNKGRRKSRTRTMIRLRYDHEAMTSYARWIAEGEPTIIARPNPIWVSYDRRSTTAEFDAARAGQQLAVVILPTDRATAETADFVKSYDSFWTRAAAGICALLTIATLVAGFAARKRASLAISST